MDVNNTTNIGKVKLIMLKGEAGNSIVSIEKTSETDTHEIYTITLTDGSTQQIAVAKGKGIVSIEKTDTVGLVDTYTITFTDDSTTTFDIINGQSYTVPQNGVLYYTGSTVPEGFEETPAPSGSGQYAEIDDTTPSVSKVYSSSKTEQLIGNIKIPYKAGIVDFGTISGTGSKTKEVVFDEPFDDNNYAIIMTWATPSSQGFAEAGYGAQNKTTNGFTAKLYAQQSLSSTATYQMYWLAIPYKE